ncbi:hypothetical protein ACFWDI_39820 [Streptomyces sp. NPDC060064]|uniref:hypothetical protein n=1 Tax=Streptomyces sp. NPDC060064 TaxID=3347049 RepID=UPI0036CA31D2
MSSSLRIRRTALIPLLAVSATFSCLFSATSAQAETRTVNGKTYNYTWYDYPTPGAAWYTHHFNTASDAAIAMTSYLDWCKTNSGQCHWNLIPIGGKFAGKDYMAGGVLNQNCMKEGSETTFVSSTSAKQTVKRSVSTSQSVKHGISNSLAVELTEKAGLLGTGIETKISNTLTYSFEEAFENQFGREVSEEIGNGEEYRRVQKYGPLSLAAAWFAPVLQTYAVELSGAPVLGLPDGYPKSTVNGDKRTTYYIGKESTDPRWGEGGIKPLTFQYGDKSSSRSLPLDLPVSDLGGARAVLTLKSVFMSASQVPTLCKVPEYSGEKGQNPTNGVVTVTPNLKPWKYFAVAYKSGSAGCAGYTRISVQQEGKSPVVAQTYITPFTGSGTYRYTRAGTETTEAGILSAGLPGKYIHVDCRDQSGVYRPAQNFMLKVWPQPWFG